MSRRKKKSRRRQDAPRPGQLHDPPALDCKPRKPSPPRPRKSLLFLTSLLLAAWIAFLIVLVVKTVS